MTLFTHITPSVHIKIGQHLSCYSGVFIRVNIKFTCEREYKVARRLFSTDERLEKHSSLFQNIGADASL